MLCALATRGAFRAGGDVPRRGVVPGGATGLRRSGARRPPRPARSSACAASSARSLHRDRRSPHDTPDFAAPALKLIVEVDGTWHRGRERLDARRDRVLGKAGWRVLRLGAELVLGDLPAAVALVREALGG